MLRQRVLSALSGRFAGYVSGTLSLHELLLFNVYTQENDENLNSNLESFDTVYFAALQVFIVASANGVRDFLYSSKP